MQLCFNAPVPLLLRTTVRVGLPSRFRPWSIKPIQPSGVIRTSSSLVQSPTTPTTSTESSTSTSPRESIPTFQDAIRLLQEYWARSGCIVWQPCNTEVGAGTMNPATFLRVLGPEPWAVAYEEPSLRPDDSRYGENPNRLQRHTQFQVILKPAPSCAQELVLGSYRALGIDVEAHDVRFVEDNWQSPALGAWGLGWEVWLDGMEVTQFTYFQQAGSTPLDVVSVEVTYGMERILMALQRKTHFRDIVFAPGISYGEIFAQSEYEMSRYNLDDADVARNSRLFDEYEAEALMLLEKKLPVPAYSYVLKASHTFNILDARGAIGVTERARFFQRMRNLSREVANIWLERRAEQNFPLLPTDSSALTGSAAKTNTHLSIPENDSELFVFEIGMEELPPADLDSMMDQVKLSFKELLKSSSLAYESLEVKGTPRRVVVFVRNLQTKQSDCISQVRGPPLRIALDESGNPTRAALGFLKKQGVTDESSIEYNRNEGYMYATVERKGKNAIEVLSEAIEEQVLKKISFTKTMRWNDTNVPFSRPIRWLMCMIGKNVVPLEFVGIRSGSLSRTLRGGDGFAKEIQVNSADSFEQVIHEHSIMLLPVDRQNVITKEAEKLAESVNGKWVCDENLLQEVVNLVENPIPILGRFDSSFLDLPDEVLVSVMKKHQRYFPVVDPKTGELMDAFIAVVNGDETKLNLDAIREGNESVLRARYSDALFFYENDTKDKKLADFVPNLDRLAFQESLGSMLDKTNRVSEIVRRIGNYVSLSAEEQKVADQTAYLAKADLASSMVVEMTSLAGIMGKHYVEKSGEGSLDVSNAVFDASLPRFSGDILPLSQAGAVVGIADRLDSLVALFGIGLAPKSTADPLALRRAAVGLVQILIDKKINASLSVLFDIVDEVQASSLKTTVGTEENKNSVLGFIEKRLEGLLLEKDGFGISGDVTRPDVVKAVLAVESNALNPYLAYEKSCAMEKLLATEEDVMSKASEIQGRTVRMLKSMGISNLTEYAGKHVDESLFECEEEGDLLSALSHEESTLKEIEDSGGLALEERLNRVASLKPVVDQFFDSVFVSVEDPAIRDNRVTMCARLALLTSEEVDLSLLQI